MVLSVSDAAADEAVLIPTVSRIAKRLRAGLGERRVALEATRELHVVITPPSRRTRSARGPGNSSSLVRTAPQSLFRSALALDPDFAMAWGGIGWCTSNLGQPDSRDRGLPAGPRPSNAHVPEGDLFLEAALANLNGDNPGALALTEQILQLTTPNTSRLQQHEQLPVTKPPVGWREALEIARTAERSAPSARTSRFSATRSIAFSRSAEWPRRARSSPDSRGVMR